MLSQKLGISMRFRFLLCAGAAFSALTAPAWAQSGAEQVVVYGALPSNTGLSSAKVPATVNSLSAADITAAHGATVLDSLGTQAPGVSLSDSQGNSMVEDLRFHGFEASPLQGTAQGIAVYQNGIRLNEAFGDTVNWDAIPQGAIARMDSWSSNPVFGLNALGGAINVIMKNGFTFDGTQATLQGGSYGHGMASVEYGETDGNFSFYGAAEGVTDSGWRLHSASNLARLYGDIGWRFGQSEIHIMGSGAQSGLGVVGPTPIQLAAQGSAAVYTWPQTSQNRIGSLAAGDTTKLGDDWQIAASAYVRTLRQRHVDGNDADFESCSTKSSFGGDICLQDDGFGTPPGGKTAAFRNQFVILNPAGQVFPFSNSAVYGTVDRTFTDTVTQGGSLQLTGGAALLGLGNYFTAGGSVDHSAIGFRSNSILGRIFPDISVAVDPVLAGSGNSVHTLGALGYAPADLAGTTNYYGLYAVDALDLTEALTVTAGFRLNVADIATRDRSGNAAELTGSHGYSHFNPLAGLTYKIADGVNVFGGYSQANRAPTSLELDCANPNQPCLLEDSLVSDPPLKQVVAETGEAGLRGETAAWDGTLNWSASAFRTNSHNDIVALGSVIQGRGYYANVPATRRQGVDLSARYKTQSWSAYANYSYLDATYQFTGALSSPNNPQADGNGNVTVTPGDHIPVNPANILRTGGDFEILPRLTVGGDIHITGSQYYDGDYANQNAKLPAYWLANLRLSYAASDNWELFGVVNNVFNRHDASYGTYFDPSNTVALFATPLTDVRSVTRIQPVSVQLGLTFKL
jgi:iron complex outermembrane receptor protein